MSERMPGAKPGPKLEETGAAVLNALQQSLRDIVSESGDEFKGANEADIAQAAFYLAVEAERARMPYTVESLQSMPPIEEKEFKDVLGLRIKTHTPETMLVREQSGDVIAGARDVNEAMRITQAERDAK